MPSIGGKVAAIKQELGLSPIPTHAIIVAQQLAATVLNFAIGRLARWIGPIGAVVVVIGGGVAALGAVCVEATPRAVVVGLLILRGALMNSTAGLTGAVLNDHVEKRHRAKWNMSAQFRQVTWSGSAFAGGALIDAIGYRKTFLFTCGFHAAMGLVLLPRCCWSLLLEVLLVDPSASRSRGRRRRSAVESCRGRCL